MESEIMMLSEISQTPKRNIPNIPGFLFYLEFSFNSKAWKKQGATWGEGKDNQT